jgi:hypothetical protein
MRTMRCAAGLAAALLAGLAGCSGDNVADQVAAMNTSNVQRLANLYAAYQNYNGGRGPKDEAAFRAFIKDFDQNKLAMMKVDPNNLDGLFTSEWDGKPFRIRYKVGGGRGSVDAVVFDQVGRDGKKRVAFTGGKVEEVGEAEAKQLWAGKGPSQPAGAPPGQGGRPTGPPTGAPTGPPGS